MRKIDIERAVSANRPNRTRRIRPSPDQIVLLSRLEPSAAAEQCGPQKQTRPETFLHAAILPEVVHSFQANSVTFTERHRSLTFNNVDF